MTRSSPNRGHPNIYLSYCKPYVCLLRTFDRFPIIWCQYARATLSADTELDRLLRAYALGYVSVTAPRLFALLRTWKRTDVNVEKKVKLVSRYAAVA